jgi:hypothetical protein
MLDTMSGGQQLATRILYTLVLHQWLTERWWYATYTCKNLTRAVKVMWTRQGSWECPNRIRQLAACIICSSMMMPQKVYAPDWKLNMNKQENPGEGGEDDAIENMDSSF